MVKRISMVLVCAAAALTLACKQDAQTKGAANQETPAAGKEEASQPVAVPAGGFGKPGELYPVLKGGKYGYIDNSGKFAIEPKFLRAARFIEDVAVVADDKSKVGYIDRQGKFVVEPQYEAGSPFSEGYATVYIGGKAGVINKKGELVIKAEYSRVGRFKNGLAPAVIVREVRTTKAEDGGYLNPEGKFLIHPQFDPNLTIFSDGLAGVRRIGQLWSFIDEKGNTAIKPQWFMLGHFSEGLAGAMDAGSRWGFVDKTGKWVIQPKFSQARFFSEGLAGIMTPDAPKWGYTDTKGNIVIKQQFEGVDQFIDGIAMVQVGTKIAYIDKTGKYVWPPTE